MPVGRSDLIKLVANETQKSVKESTTFVNATLEAIRKTLESGDSVRLVGFGVFSVKDTAASVRVNPQTREKINVPARKRVKFSAGKELLEAVGGSTAKAAAPAKASAAKAEPAKTAKKK